MIDISTIHWYRADIKLPTIITHTLPSTLKHWLLDTDSLTAKLKSHYSGFNVELISNQPMSVTDDIASILGTTTAYERQVYLRSHNKRLVYAISFIPSQCSDLLTIGNTPLGEVLFNTATRERIEVSLTDATPGRRSIFNYQSHPIIVCEFFITPLLPLKDYEL